MVTSASGDSNSGTQYKLQDNSQFGFQYQADAAQHPYTYKDTYRIISSGSGDNLFGEYTFKVTIDANGKPHIISEYDYPQCRG